MQRCDILHCFPFTAFHPRHGSQTMEIIGAVSASLHLTESLFKYFRAFKDPSQDAERLAEEVAGVDRVLQVSESSTHRQLW